jgi:hypothetical protein
MQWAKVMTNNHHLVSTTYTHEIEISQFRKSIFIYISKRFHFNNKK